MSAAAVPDLEPSLTLFDGASELMCVRDMQGRFVRVNKAWEATLGISTDDVCNTPLLPLVHPADVPATLQRMAEADRCHQVVDFVNRYRRRDGEYRDLQWRAHRVGDVILGRARDISAERLLADQAQVARLDLDETLADLGARLSAPTATILTAVQALGETELTLAQRELMRTLGRSVETLEEMIANLVKRERAAASAASASTVDRHRFAAPRINSMPRAANIQFVPSYADSSKVLGKWIVEMAQHANDHSAFHRSFREVSSRLLGLLAIRLAHLGQSYPSRLQSVSVASGLMSAGRTSAILARMQNIGFIEVAAQARFSRVRPYRIDATMTRSFAALLAIDLRCLAPTNYRAVLALEAIEAREDAALSLLTAFAGRVLDDLQSGGNRLTESLAGAASMARGQSIALAIAAEAIERHGVAGEGWIAISLSDYAHRFDVSRVQVRRIVERLERCGLRRDSGSPSRLFVTAQFTAAIEDMRRASCDLLATALARAI